MKFDFRIKNAACNNDRKAIVREACRCLSIAHGLEQLGYEVVVSSVADLPDHRMDPFRHLLGRRDDNADVAVWPAEWLPAGPSDAKRTVGIKCSVSCKNDGIFIEHCDLLVAHENDPNLSGYSRMLSVPFLVHDYVFDWLCENGLIESYLRDDLGPIRDRFKQERKPRVCFAGTYGYGRKEKLEALGASTSQFTDVDDIGLLDVHWTDAPREPWPIERYLRWISGYAAGIDISGDTPKANRFSDLVLFGTAVVNVPCPVPVTPTIDGCNTILLRDWTDAGTLKADIENADVIADDASEHYVAGWSPRGQAQLIAERLL